MKRKQEAYFEATEYNSSWLFRFGDSKNRKRQERNEKAKQRLAAKNNTKLKK